MGGSLLGVLLLAMGIKALSRATTPAGAVCFLRGSASLGTSLSF